MTNVSTAFEEPRIRQRLREALRPIAREYLVGAADYGTAAMRGRRASYGASLSDTGRVFPFDQEPILGGEGIFLVSSSTAETDSNLLSITSDSPQASTASTEIAEAQASRQMEKTIHALLAIAAEERFEDGVESNLGEGLKVLLHRHPSESMKALRAALSGQAVSRFVLAAMLHVVGQQRGFDLANDRLAFLLSYLTHSSMFIRDAAAVGLAYANDPRAIPALRRAIEREQYEPLREDLTAVLMQIETGFDDTRGTQSRL